MKNDLFLRVLQSARGKPLSVDDVLQRARLDVGAKPHVRQALRTLVKEGKVEQDGKRFVIRQEAPPAAEPKPPPHEKRPGRPPRGEAHHEQVPPIASVQAVLPLTKVKQEGGFVGTLRRHRDGYGFIASIEGGDDLFVPPQAMGDALDGDLVRARPGPGRDGRPVAKFVEVVERRRQLAVGTYRVAPHQGGAVVEPRDESLPAVHVKPFREANDGDVVRVKLEKFEDGLIFGTVVSRLGQPGDPDAEVLSVAYGEGFSDVFPPEVLIAAESVPPEVRTEDKAGRRDLTGIQLVTIDGEDARDFDDAIYVERTPHGFRLVVAIADVTAYVTETSALDREALKRATSVYFPQHVLPMLPERLSNGICSLNPKVERLCMVADMVLDGAGKPQDAELYPAVMRSHARCTYTQVAKLLGGEEVSELAHVKEMLLLAGDLAKKLTKQRMARGAIDFDIPEAYIKLGENHQVAAIEKRPRNDAHRLVEEFMLAANEAVARYFQSRELPTVYRVHGPPKEEKLRAFAELAAAFGYDIPLDDPKTGISPAALNDFLERVQDRPEQRPLNHLLLRSMMQAVYSAENIGHFGLAAEAYLHFTSPIRRYPDLIVHRLLKQHWGRGGRIPSEHERANETEQLEAVAVHCSERERASTNAEREIDSYYAAAFMVSRVGQRFAGTVASVAEFGIFIEIDDPYVEGLVRSETIGEGAELDAEKHRLVFKRSGRSFGVGDRVEVEVISADPVTRRIELKLVEKGQLLDAAPQRTRLLADAIDELKKQRRPKPGGKSGGRGGAPERGRPQGKPKGQGKGGKPKQEKRPKQRHQRRGR